MTDWDWWQDKLAGKPVEMNPSMPHAGFYRMPSKAFYGARKTFLPVAYWRGETGWLNCRLGDEDIGPERGQEIWERVGNHPVSEEAYRVVAEKGGLWPDEHELVPMGDNLPPEDEDTFEGLQDKIENLAREAEKRLEGPPIADQAEADRVGNLIDRLAELWKKGEEIRKNLRKPYDEALKEIQRKWSPLLTKAEVYKNLKYVLINAWLDKQTKAAKFQAEQAAAEGNPLPADTPRPRAGTRGRAITQRTIKRAEITDYAACLEYFADSVDVRGTVQDLANRAVRAGATAVPGVKVIEEQKAV